MKYWRGMGLLCTLMCVLCLSAACGRNGKVTTDDNAAVQNEDQEAGQENRTENQELTPSAAPEPTQSAEAEEPVVLKEKTDLVEFCLQKKEMSGNPIITHIFTADPSAHVWEDGRIYIYASHDMDPARGCDLMDRYHVFSSNDMVNWVDEGEILSSDDVAWGRPEGGFMWAPDCAYRNGTYYFYYPHPSESSWNASWKIGVATSDKPNEGFVDQGYIEGLGGDSMIDPCVFIDDDDRVYMYYGGGGKCLGGEMNADMVSLKDGMQPMQGLQDFHEGAWVFKREGIYYLIYSDNQHGANRMRYAASASPLGPWTYQGIFLESTGCDTSHGSVVEYQGNWYLFYHNQNVSGTGVLRSVCVDRLEFDENGAIVKVIQTREGVPAVGSAAGEEYPNGIYQSVKGYDVRNCEVSGGAKIDVKADDTGEAAVYNLYLENSKCTFNGIDGGEGGRATIFIHYASGVQWTKFRVWVNGEDYSLINAKSTGSWADYTGVTQISVELEPGTNNTIDITGGYNGINIDGIVVGIFEK